MTEHITPQKCSLIQTCTAAKSDSLLAPGLLRWLTSLICIPHPTAAANSGEEQQEAGGCIIGKQLQSLTTGSLEKTGHYAALGSKEKQDWRKGGPQKVLEVQVKTKQNKKQTLC